MKITRAYKFRMYPNIEQQVYINKCIGCSRFVYNHFLEIKKDNSYYTKYDLFKMLPDLENDFEFLKEVDNILLQNSITDLCNAFLRYNKKLAEYPKYKVKGLKESYRTNAIRSTYKESNYCNIEIDLKNNIIKLPKLREVKIRGYRHLEYLNGKILNATISKVASKYYVSLCVEEEIPVIKNTKKRAVGIDVGVKSLVVTSDGDVFGNPKYIEKYEKKIRGLQKGLSRCQKGSKNYQKAKIRLSIAYQKLKNARKKKAEEIVAKVIKENDIIITENLNVKNMLAKENNPKKLRKKISNATFGEILRIFEYKCRWLNKVFIKVNTYYPSSQICSSCGSKDNKLKDLSIRKYECLKCGNEIDRDLGASINILTEGLFKNYQLIMK